MCDKIEPPLKNGEETILVIKVIDENKAFDYIGKHLLNKVDGSECGFTIEHMYLSKDRYKESMNNALRQEVINDIENYGNRMVDSIISKIK